MSSRSCQFYLWLSWLIIVILGGGFLEDGVMANDNFADNPFGILEFLHWDYPWSNYKYAKQKDLERAVALIKELGVGMVRLDFLWEDIEPEPGRFEFAKYDQIVNLLLSNKIQVLGLLQYSVSWASVDGNWNSPPKNFAWFVRYAAEVVGRYRGKVNYWEIWNEPDSHIYWSAQDGLKSYCELLKNVYIAAKKVNPECLILNGGLANGLTSVRRLYENGAGQYFDILNVHYFDSPYREGAIKAVVAFPNLVRKVMSQYGDKDKKIWLTEIGCPGVPEGAKTADWWLGKNPDEDTQAEWLAQVYNELLKDKKVEKIFWAFLRDCDKHWLNGIDYFGLVRWDFSLKPAFFQYRNIIDSWKKNMVN